MPYAVGALMGGLEGLRPPHPYQVSPISNTTYALEEFGEAPGTLWVWAPGLPESLQCSTRTAAVPLYECYRFRILEGLRPSKPPYKC
jgi:hypothetical protein